MADHEGLGHVTSLVSTAAFTEVHMHRAFRLLTEHAKEAKRDIHKSEVSQPTLVSAYACHHSFLTPPSPPHPVAPSWM